MKSKRSSRRELLKAGAVMSSINTAYKGDFLSWTINLVEAKKLAYADLERYDADPGFSKVPTDRLISKSYAGELCAKIDPKKATVAVQGYGNAGSIAATLMVAEGAKVIAVSDTGGAIHKADGLNIPKVLAWKQEHGTVVGFPGSKTITNAQLLELECDVLIPAAYENQITAANVKNVKAKIIAEAANGPTTPEADEVLAKRGVFMIPDILCNAGGVTVSYFEWVQDLNCDHWSEEVVNAKLREIMVRSFGEVYAMSKKERVHMRTAAYLVAVKRVADATALRGLYP